MTTTIDRQIPGDSGFDRASRPGAITVTQYSRRGILAIWAAAALPMGALAWIVVPALADGGASLTRALIVGLTAGLIWQFVLVVGLVGYEQRSLRWSRLREALWLRPPRSPRTGRAGGRTWLVVIPLIVGLAAEELIPDLPHAMSRELGEFLSSDAGRTMFSGSWGWFAVVMTMLVFNTVLGEELLFRGVLLPRMHGAFGDRDWVANGVLFATYHLHVPWVIPAALLGTLTISYPTKRYQSAWIGIAVHSAQSVVFAVLILTIVM
ncbi:MAG: CPBP family intramembrane glutamic endopeptidase [Acidimicrobiales bacterium]